MHGVSGGELGGVWEGSEPPLRPPIDYCSSPLSKCWPNKINPNPYLNPLPAACKLGMRLSQPCPRGVATAGGVRADK
jgi:hypothetical protein